MTTKATPPQDSLAKARLDMAEKIGVAGWKESFQEKIIWIRRVFQIALFLLSICSFYYSYQVIEQWRNSGYTDEIKEVIDNEFLPFSNVTICAQIYLNKTFVKENIVIPANVLHRYTKKTGGSVDALYEQLTLFLIQTLRPKNVDPSLLVYFSQILRANPQLNDLSAFTIAGLPKCENMLKRCWFNGREFDCCDRAVLVLDDDGVCYLLALNFDSDNAVPSILTRTQTEPGPSGGLTVEALVSLKATPWLDGVVSNGFRIYVSAAPFGAFQSPLGAPHDAETFVKMTPTKHQLSINFASHGHLKMKGENLMYYDPEGFSCIYIAMESRLYKYHACYMQLPLYSPNSSIACTPIVAHGLETFLTGDLEKNALRPRSEDPDEESRIATLINDMENDLKTSMSVKSKCPSHCSYWSYTSSASFVYLEKHQENNPENQDAMFSKIHVYYGDFGYRQYHQVKEMSFYLAFCNFGNVAVLCWGMSLISFFHLFFYVTRYCIVLWKSRKQSTRVQPVTCVRNITVAPAVRIVAAEALE